MKAPTLSLSLVKACVASFLEKKMTRKDFLLHNRGKKNFIETDTDGVH